MEIISLSKELYETWDKFCMQSDDAWWRSTTYYLDYSLHYKPELRPISKSFMVFDNNVLIAICPLIIETNGEINEFSYGNEHGPAPAFANNLTEKERKKIKKFVFNHIDDLAKENDIKRIRMKFPVLNNNHVKYNYLMKFGFFNTTLNTQIIDLNKSEDELWNNIRRNHRRSIKKGNEFKIIIYTSKNITKDIFYAYKNMHHKASGRKTRPDKTFELMYDFLLEDLGFLVVVEYEGKQIGFEYYTIYKNNVYGFSAANDPEYEIFPIRHKLEWETILWMKKMKFSFFEIGLQQYGNQLYDFPDKKQINISHFKKGFGGFTVPVFSGEKFYSKEFCFKILSNRIKKLDTISL